jgi:hypothetical protein
MSLCDGTAQLRRYVRASSANFVVLLMLVQPSRPPQPPIDRETIVPAACSFATCFFIASVGTPTSDGSNFPL